MTACVKTPPNDGVVWCVRAAGRLKRGGVLGPLADGFGASMADELAIACAGAYWNVRASSEGDPWFEDRALIAVKAVIPSWLGILHGEPTTDRLAADILAELAQIANEKRKTRCRSGGRRRRLH